MQKTAHMELATLSDDPDRDADVPQLLWEIRRERRMEFAFEQGRIIDLRRWHKLNYMDTTENPDILWRHEKLCGQASRSEVKWRFRGL